MKNVQFYPTVSCGLQLKWGDGWIEVFPEDEFAEECTNRPRKIVMYHNRRGRNYESCEAEYSLTVKDKIALLDYGGRFEEVNSSEERDFYIGITQIKFKDENRTSVISVKWRDKGKTVFEDNDIANSWGKSLDGKQSTPFVVPSTQDKKRRNALSVLRPGQLRFRTSLLNAYNSKCCITGFNVPVALEAAHIIAYQGTEFDHIQNGLLVRADIHRLLDSYLISIDPKTRSVKVANSLRNTTNYPNLDGVKLIEPRNKSSRPSEKALLHHWKQFKAKHN